MAKKDLKKKEETGLAVPSYIDQGSRTGLEKMRDQDVVYPRIVLLQALSPIVREKDSPYNAGDMINSVTLELICERDTQREFIPILFWPEWIEWGPRSEGGGVIGMSRDPMSELAQRAKANEKRDVGGKTVMAVTEYLTFLILLADRPPVTMADAVCLSCAKSNYKHGKRLLNLARLRGNVPLFAGKYTLSAASEHNARSNSDYWAYGLENAGFASEEQYAFAKEAYELLKDHEVKAAEMRSETEDSESAGDTSSIT